MDGVSALTLIAVLSFAIERIATGVMVLLWPHFPDPKKPEEEKEYKKWRFGFAAVLAVIAIHLYGQTGILFALGVPLRGGSDPFFDRWPGLTPALLLDYIITVIVLAGGADHLAALQEAISKARKEAVTQEPIAVKGTLRLDEQTKDQLTSEAPAIR